MRFFDAHCDTVMHALDDGLDFVAGSRGAHLDLPRLEAAGSCVQLFAIFMAAGHYPPDGEMRPHAERALAAVHGWVAGSGGRLRLALTGADVRTACAATAGGPVYGLIGLEGADCLEGNAENLRHFAAAGVRNVIPAWADNSFSGTVFGQKGPLTAEGARLIALCEQLRVMVDVSHLSDAAFWQVFEMTGRPFIASHSNCRAVSPSSRNLTDEMLRSLADRGGVMGINLAPDFLSPDFYEIAWPIYIQSERALAKAPDAAAKDQITRDRDAQIAVLPRPGREWIVRHVQHAIQVGGEDCVGLGGDLDGLSFLPAGMTGVESYPALVDLFVAAGLSDRQVEKVCWRNMARVFEDVLP